jgi:hypothetical protein
MWTKSAEERLEELGLTEKQIEQLSDKTMVGVGIITSVLLEAIKQGLVDKKEV